MSLVRFYYTYSLEFTAQLYLYCVSRLNRQMSAYNESDAATGYVLVYFITAFYINVLQNEHQKDDSFFSKLSRLYIIICNCRSGAFISNLAHRT